MFVPLRLLLAASLGAAAAVASGVAPAGFAFSGVTNRLITPNGDGKNDAATFTYSNPQDASGEVRIYDPRGRLLRTIAIDPGVASVSWDAKSDGQVVRSGVYVYVVLIEKRAFSGALVVVK